MDNMCTLDIWSVKNAIITANKNRVLRGEFMKDCKSCKYYNECSKDIYHANIERDYSIVWGNRDCWEADD